MLKHTKGKTSGFTIIETMIVLAIAGLIMLIVFLAVPALQRSARNTQRKNDVAGIASAIANYIDNNGGTLPNSTAPNGATSKTVLIGNGCSATGTPPCTGNSESVKLGYYNPSNVQYYSGTSTLANGDTIATLGVTGAPSGTSNFQEYVLIVNGWTCNSNNTALGSPNDRTAAVLYQLEGAGNSYECQEQ